MIPSDQRATATPAHPALEAWRSLGGDPKRQSRVERLTAFNGRKTWKSEVYRITCADQDTPAVVAKRAAPASIAVEELVYCRMLPGVPVTGVQCLGTMVDHTGSTAWLFLEEVTGAAFQPENPLHRTAATEWLATVHVATSRAAAPVGLPDRGVDHHARALARARGELELARQRADLKPSARTVLDATSAALTTVDRSWGGIADLLAGWPNTLVHGDFTTKNVRVSVDGSSLSMRVIDWDIAGWGPPAADVSVVAPEHYRQLTRDEWPYLSVGEIERFREVGRLLQAMLWIGQTASAAGASGGRAVRRLDQYRRIVMAAHAAVAR